MYFVKTPHIVKPLYPSAKWCVETNEKVLYFTFDDGPVPSVTDATFEILDSFSAKACFFLIGENIERHPDYIAKYAQNGHSIGNHSFQHLNGWKTPTAEYTSDVINASESIASTLFRPPYGRITRKQVKHLELEYTLCMWDVLSGDFDPTINVDSCIKNVVDHVEPGSIVVFHDSEKASKVMLASLPIILDQLKKRGYQFKALSEIDFL